jgi:hypothetical protein
MKPFVVSMLFAVVALMTAASRAQAQPDPGYGWAGDYAEMVDRASDILQSIDSPARKSALAEQWLDFSKRVITKTLDQRNAWLNLQERQLHLQQQAQQDNVDLANLQLRIEQLRAQNLKLENENLQLKQKLQGQPAEAPSQAANTETPTAVPPAK